MRHLYWMVLLSVLIPTFELQSFADAGCEKRIRDTKMIFAKADPKIICDRNPTLDTQNCMVEILAGARGKLRNTDLFEIDGVCTTDSRPEIRACMLKGLNKKWNEPGYRGAKKVGTECLMKRRPIMLKAKTTKPVSNNAAPHVESNKKGATPNGR